jgi:hypothetical protein
MASSTGQYNLYDGVPPHEALDTSIEAAHRIVPDIGRLQSEVLAFIAARGPAITSRHSGGGATCWEVEEELELRHQTASARIRELVLKDFVRDSSVRRLTGSGRRAVVWELVR